MIIDPTLATLIAGLGGAAIGGVIGALGVLVSWKMSTRQLDAQKAIAAEALKSQEEQARRRILADVLSANRIRWIEQLRGEIAAFVASTFMLTVEVDGAKFTELRPRLESLDVHLATIVLLLNLKEPDHKALLNAANEMRRVAYSDRDDKTEAVGEIRNKVVRIGRRILKTEWERVKLGE